MPRCLAPDHAVPDEHDRLRGAIDELRCARDGLLAGLGIAGPPDREGHRHDLALGDVLGQLDVRRAGLLKARQAERFPNDLWRGLRKLDARIPFHDRREHPQHVNVLV